MNLVTYSNYDLNLIFKLLIKVTKGRHQRHKWKSIVFCRSGTDVLESLFDFPTRAFMALGIHEG